jgi:hypothetical protein
MHIDYYFDDTIPNLLIITFHKDWTWAEYMEDNTASLSYPPNMAIPAGERVDSIVDFTRAPTLPNDGVGVLRIAEMEKIAKDSPYDIPRNGGTTVYIGNPSFITALLRTFGLDVKHDMMKKFVAPTIEQAREHRAQK